MANLQKATGHGHFLEMKNSEYHCPYVLAECYLYSLQDEKTMIVLVQSTITWNGR